MLDDTSDEGGAADEPGSFSLLILELEKIFSIELWLRQVGFRGATIPNLKVR